MTVLLELQNVTAGYSSDIDILNDLSLGVSEHGITGLIGLNGAGKSTVTKVVAGLIHPRAGRILFGAEDITETPAHRMIERSLWLVPQESSLFPHLSVADNLTLPLEHLRRSTGKISKDEIAERLAAVYTRFPMLREKRRDKAGSLSGGQQKTLELAKAYLIRPRLCLIDEPTIGLSPRIAEDVYQLIAEFAVEGMTILMIDHNVRQVVRMVDTLYVLTLGRVSAQGSAKEFQANLHGHVRQWLGIDL